MSDFERMAVQRVLDRAREVGLDVPKRLSSALLHASASPAAAAFAARYPDDDPERHGCPVEALLCCVNAWEKGLAACMCWEPVFDVDQAEPEIPASPDDLAAQPRMCGDCAYRPDSPERSEEFTAEALLDLPGQATPFWCHDGIRRPVEWRHPGMPGVMIPGDPSDYQPPIIAGIPFRADGRPGLLCAGWAARAAQTRH